MLARADVVVYDRLSVASLLELAPPSAERISVGKAPGHRSMEQGAINELLVERGRSGAEVVRLKGGDPFVFARGGEEAQALREAGVPFEVIPGVTSAIAVPAYAGVPLTQRGVSTSFTVVTGHEDPWAATETDWDAVARVGGTIVVLMGVATRDAIAQRLIAGGLAASTPVAAIRWGTRPEQQTIRTTLAELGSVDLEPPATMVIGGVAGLDVSWFESRPLFGKRVVVTRARDQASALTVRLAAHGASVIEVPTIVVRDPADGGDALRTAAASAGQYAWVVFTSVNAVGRFFACLRDARDLAGTRVAAIGSGTAAALGERGIVPDLVPAEFVAESLLAAFPDATSSQRGAVLLPRAAVARDVLPEGLRGKGWHVDVVEAYGTDRVEPSADLIKAAADADAITFTSSSTVTNYVEALGVDHVPPVVACIGPITAATARALGLSVDAIADEHTIDGLVRALEAAFAAEHPA